MNKSCRWFPAAWAPGAFSIRGIRFCLTAAASAPYAGVSQSAGRSPLSACRRGGGKSGLQTDAAPDNVRRGRPQGKRHRKQTAGSWAATPESPARVKGCGKSAPRGRQRQRHGKPRREQDRIGAMRGVPRGLVRWPCRSGWLLEAPGDGRPRGMAVTSGQPGHTEPGLQAGWRCFRSSFKVYRSGSRS